MADTQKPNKSQFPNDDPNVYDPGRREEDAPAPVDLNRLQQLHVARDEGRLSPAEERELGDLEKAVEKTQGEGNPNQVDMRPSVGVDPKNR